MQQKKLVAGWVASSAAGARHNPHRHSDSDSDTDRTHTDDGEDRASDGDGEHSTANDAIPNIDTALLENDWDAFLSTHLQPRIFAPAAHTRIAFLHRAARQPAFLIDHLHHHSQLAEIHALLRTSISRIHDRTSRLAILALVRALLFAPATTEAEKEKRLLTNIHALVLEANRSANLAPLPTRAALLDWLIFHLTFLTELTAPESKPTREQVLDPTWPQQDALRSSKALVPLLNAIAVVIDSISAAVASSTSAPTANAPTTAAAAAAAAAAAFTASGGSSASSTTKAAKFKRKHAAVVQGALVILRRQLRLAYRHLPTILDVVLPTSPSASTPSSTKHAPLIGTLLSVLLRLRAFSEPVKGSATGLGRVLLERHKHAIIAFYAEHVLGAAGALKGGALLPPQVREAFTDYFSALAPSGEEKGATRGLVDPATDIQEHLLPAFNKNISKAPESSLPLLLAFLTALPPRQTLVDESRLSKEGDLWEEPLWPAVFSAAKSSSIGTRQAAVDVFKALVERLLQGEPQDAVVARFVMEILDGPLRAGPVAPAAAATKGSKTPAPAKSGGATAQPQAAGEVRATLYALLASIPPGPLSPLIARSLSPCLTRDVSAAAPLSNWLAGPESLVRACLDALVPHLRAALQGEGGLSEKEASGVGEAVGGALGGNAPGGNVGKVNARRAIWARVGDLFVAPPSSPSPSASASSTVSPAKEDGSASGVIPASKALSALAGALVPSLEAALKAAYTTPLGIPPVEGYVSISLALHLGLPNPANADGENGAAAPPPFAKLWTSSELLKGKVGEGLLCVGGKTGFFLLNDKVWRKAGGGNAPGGATTTTTTTPSSSGAGAGAPGSGGAAAPTSAKDAANHAASTRASVLVQEEQELWLLRALGGVLLHPESVRQLGSTLEKGHEVPVNPAARAAYGAGICHLTLDVGSMFVRQASLGAVQRWMQPLYSAGAGVVVGRNSAPNVVRSLLAASLREWVRAKEAEVERERERVVKAGPVKVSAAGDEDAGRGKTPRSFGRDVRGLLLTIASGATAVAQVQKKKTVSFEEDGNTGVPDPASDMPPSSSSGAEEPAVLAQDLALLDLLILAHVSELGAPAETGAVFVELCQSSAVDPHELVVRRQVEALGAVRATLQTKGSTKEADGAETGKVAGSSALHGAAIRALSTLAFIAPEQVIPAVVKQITTELVQLPTLSALTHDDLGMWSTEPGTLFDDPLTRKTQETTAVVVSTNRKDAEMEKWDAEVRASIAKKKAEAAAAAGGKAPILTAAQRKEVDAQLRLEADVRARVAGVKEGLVQALESIVALVKARSEVLDAHLPQLVDHLLRVLRTPQANELAGFEVRKAFDQLLSCASARLTDYKRVMGMALLRTVDETLVPEDFRSEPLKETVLRVLYRVRFLSEQAPLDLATVAFLAPLIHTIVEVGGLGVGEEDDQDGVFEQMQLALDFLTFHCEACEDPRMPRAHFIDDFVQITAKHTQLSKEAVSGLRSLGEAMRTSATPEELQKLFGHLLSDAVYVRTGCLQALQPLDLTDLDFCAELWLACHDEDDENVRLAEKAWEENGLDVPANFPESLVPYLTHPHAYVRKASGKAIAAAAEMHPEEISQLLPQLFGLYHEKAKMIKPEYDQFGMVIDGTANQQDPWRARVGIALTIRHLAPYLNPLTDVPAVFDFLVSGQAVGDRSDRVRQRMLDAGSTIIDLHGAECLSRLMTMFESFFTNSSQVESSDGVMEAVVILFGRLARHLAQTDKRVKSVVDKLLDALRTPSELVQSAVSECLSPLIGAVQDEVPTLFEKLFSDLFDAAKYAERRGAAYGLAGIIKGRGIGSIAEFRVMQKLADAAEDKRNVNARQGAMFAYETLTATLERLFEPYIQQILPHLLTCFGDSSPDVREATQDAARVIMKTVSGHCVKLILPSLLEGLREKQWRTKKGAIELLGAMAYCAPRQLSISLPTVIPQLSGVLTDSHTQVRNAANTSLKQFGSVISNPEIKKLVATLLQALIEPNSKTAPALGAVLNTSFVHYIDSSSLALLVPIVDRGLRERSAQVQKDAARIVGNLAGLTDSKDFVPYLSRLVPLVRIVLVSPVPEARAVSAKALGTLVERLGENHFIDLIPSLLHVLRSDATSVDRQGSAQGLAEVLAGLGVERMEALLPDIINGASSNRPYVREGYISLLIYLPATFGHRFSPHLGRIIPPILGGIADDSESVRDASMRAGRMIIANYSIKAVDLLLPELQKGLFDSSWRIRMSSVQLAADLLFRLSGISGKNQAEGDDEDGDEGGDVNFAASNTVQKALIEALGQERRDRILAALFIIRQDPNIPVRQAAIHTWKALVANTHRTAREILPVMLDMLVTSLGAQGPDQREIASRTIAELVRKLGEKILRETIPLLRVRGATATDSSFRAGVCLAVTEILENATRSQLEDHEDALIAIIRHSLVDEAAEVRAAAAEA
ncbi:unnamed protein product, partial [Tilletia controversa]